MAYFRRPSMADRTISTPQSLYTSSPVVSESKYMTPRSRIDMMTPPLSPASPRYSRSSIDISSGSEELRAGFAKILKLRGGQAPETSETKSDASYTDEGILICPYDVDILQDSRNQMQTFGSGAWSTVFKGTCRVAGSIKSGLMTPPLTPPTSPPVLVAVKVPVRKDAVTIVESEANILTHLMSESEHENYIVQFYGINQKDSSLVLDAVPQTLEDYIKTCSIQKAASRTMYNMTQPVIGSERTWLDLADRLVSALYWLHDQAMVVHGDIKPGNILLSSPINHFTNTEITQDSSCVFPYIPLFADFSSSQLLANDTPTPNTLSAITREYTAPELLSSKVLLDPNSSATTSSDVFSLAVTLLVAATGNTMVYGGSGFQRQFMATQGWSVISNVRNSDEGLRLPRHGMVERVLEKAVLKMGMGRIEAQKWVELVDTIKRGEPKKP